MDILNELTFTSPSTYFTAEFKLCMENMLPFVKNSQSLRMFNIEPYESAVFEGDFYSLMEKYKVPKHEHYLTLRLNGMRSPTDYTGEAMSFYLPPAGFVQKMESLMRVQIM